MLKSENITSDYRDLYKNVSQLKHQQAKRRAKLLEEQRKKRDDEFSAQRNLKQIFKNHKKRNRSNDLFRNNLMLSEWMMARPDDIEDFFVIACPKGIRCSLSTGENKLQTARLYYKDGVKFLELKSNLPAFTILDCIFCEASRTIFVLDVLYFDDRELLNCDSSFRFFWLKSKFAETEFTLTNSDNRIELSLLEPREFSNSEAVREVFEALPAFSSYVELDGFLFYHKDAFYAAGQTPFVLWLFPFMLEELFREFRVNPAFNNMKPHDYSNHLEFIEKFEAKAKSRLRRRNKSCDSSMEIETNEPQIMDDSEFDEMQSIIELQMQENNF